MSASTHEHRSRAPKQVGCAVITISDSRTEATDVGGQLLVDLMTDAGHQIVKRKIIPDEPEQMRELLGLLSQRDDIDVILMTGGTGVSPRDQTYETVAGILDKTLPGYGELFRHLSYADIGTAAIMSRATGGVLGKTVVLTMPGSPAGVRLATEKIILPELGHLVATAQQ